MCHQKIYIMKQKKIRFFACFLLITNSMFMFGQKDTYLAEIGVSGGVSFYKGDGSSSLFSNLQPVYGGLLRYNINPAFALCFDLSRTSIKGSYIDSNVTYTFKNQNDALDVLVEFNFFDLEQIKNNDNQERKLSPYIFAGYGLLKYSYENQSKLNPQFPFGIGLKYKLKNRWNLNLQWTNRVLFADDMEGKAQLNDKFKLNGSNFFNNDVLSGITLSVTFDFLKKPCNCHGSLNNRL